MVKPLSFISERIGYPVFCYYESGDSYTNLMPYNFGRKILAKRCFLPIVFVICGRYFTINTLFNTENVPLKKIYIVILLLKPPRAGRRIILCYLYF